MEPTAAAKIAEEDKRRKYSNLENHYDFIPIGVETMGCFGPAALEFMKELGGKLISSTGEKKAASYLIQRLSIAIVRGNANAIISCLPRAQGLLDFEELLC